MTKDEYFASVRKNPWSFPRSVVSDLPDQWIADAWELPQVQSEAIAGGIVRQVSKTGSLCESGEYLSRLAEVLSGEQVKRLYLAILSKDELAALLGMTVEEMEASS